jgi:hypothetical protein
MLFNQLRLIIPKPKASSPPLGRLRCNHQPGNGWHQTLDTRILLEHYVLHCDLEAQNEAFVDHYIHQRYHQSLNAITPSDADFGRHKVILHKRERTKRKTIKTRRLHHRTRAA